MGSNSKTQSSDWYNGYFQSVLESIHLLYTTNRYEAAIAIFCNTSDQDRLVSSLNSFAIKNTGFNMHIRSLRAVKALAQ